MSGPQMRPQGVEMGPNTGGGTKSCSSHDQNKSLQDQDRNQYHNRDWVFK